MNTIFPQKKIAETFFRMPVWNRDAFSMPVRPFPLSPLLP